jgi:hypothetical protein
MEPVVDTVENLTFPKLGNLEFQKLENVCLDNSLFDIFDTESYFMDALNIISDFNISVCLGFCFLQKTLPYARTVLPDLTSITKTFNFVLIRPSKAFIAWCFTNWKLTPTKSDFIFIKKDIEVDNNGLDKRGGFLCSCKRK